MDLKHGGEASLLKNIEKVVKLKLNGKIFTLNEVDGRYYSPDGNWANYVEILKDEVIELSVKNKANGKKIQT